MKNIPTIEEAVKRLKNLEGEKVALIVWTTSDVLHRAKAKGIKINKETAEAIIDKMDRRQDASLGITWETIDCHLDDYK